MLGEHYEKDDPRAVYVQESKGIRDLEAPEISFDKFKQTMKIMKVNIGTMEDPTFAIIGDYWDDLTMGKVIDLLHEFQGLFSTKYFEMKGISMDMG